VDRKRRAGSEIEHPHRAFIAILECDVSRLSGAVPILSPPVQTQTRSYRACPLALSSPAIYGP